MKFGVKRLTDTAKIPTKAHNTDSGWDLYADSFSVNSYGVLEVKTGIALQLPPGYEAKIEDKSGIGKRGTYVLGGVIDETYTGEIVVMLGNSWCHIIDYNGVITECSEFKIGDAYPYFRKGDKVAQLVIKERVLSEVEEIFELEHKERGEKGFGSSGR